MGRYTHISTGNANGNLARGITAYLTARTDTYVNAYGVTDVDPTAYGNIFTHANPPFVGNVYPYVIRSADSKPDRNSGE